MFRIVGQSLYGTLIVPRIRMLWYTYCFDKEWWGDYCSKALLVIG